MVGISAIALIFLMNVSYAFNHYGMLSNNLWTQIFAQGSTSSGSGGSTSGGGQSSCTGGNGTPGGNIYLFCDLKSKPSSCTLYKYIDASGNVQYATEQPGAGFKYEYSTVDGAKNNCKGAGNGCEVFSCHQTTNIPSNN